MLISPLLDGPPALGRGRNVQRPSPDGMTSIITDPASEAAHCVGLLLLCILLMPDTLIGLVYSLYSGLLLQSRSPHI